LETQQKSSLFDISDWNGDGSWKVWNLGDVPHSLQPQALLLINELKGEAQLIEELRTTEVGGPKVTQSKKATRPFSLIQISQINHPGGEIFGL
jgi:hypothetical protein